MNFGINLSFAVKRCARAAYGFSKRLPLGLAGQQHPILLIRSLERAFC